MFLLTYLCYSRFLASALFSLVSFVTVDELHVTQAKIPVKFGISRAFYSEVRGRHATDGQTDVRQKRTDISHGHTDMQCEVNFYERTPCEPRYMKTNTTQP